MIDFQLHPLPQALRHASSDPDDVPDALDIKIGHEITEYNKGLYTGNGARIRAAKGYQSQAPSSLVRRSGLSSHTGNYLKTNEVMHVSSASEPAAVQVNRGNRCRVSQFYCSWDDRCINMHRRCDGYTNCRNGEDEKDCTLYLRNHAPLPESRSSMPEPAALLSSSRAHAPQSPTLRQPVKQTLTTTSTSTAAPVQVQVKETDAPRVNPVWDWYSEPIVQEHLVEANTTTKAPTPLVANTLPPRTRLMHRWAGYSRGRWPSAPGVTEPGMDSQTVSHKRITTTTTTTEATAAPEWDKNYDQRLPVPESVPKEMVKQENTGTDAKILDPGRNRGTEQRMRCQCTCSPSLF